MLLFTTGCISFVWCRRWLCQLWNTSISPAIADAVIKGSGADSGVTGGGQTKVASTALYVLMQRAIVPGCPLSGQGNSLSLTYLLSFAWTQYFQMNIDLYDGNFSIERAFRKCSGHKR